jgi:O-antigen/teichoic acid export membrane protein
MKIISKFFKQLINDSLYRNSIYLILSPAIMAILGFLFWIICARLFTTEQVGLGTTLISIMSLVSGFSVLGLGNGLIRFLPASDKKNEKINTSFTLVTMMSILISVIYLIFLKTFSPKLLFIRENIWFSILFITFITINSLNTIVEYIFIAYRSSKFILIKNTVFSILKLIFPIILVTLGSYGVFTSNGIAIIIAFLTGIALLIIKFNYSPKPAIDRDILKKIYKFSLGNYIAGLIGGFPGMILPILITNLLGAKYSAYFYMSMMIATLIYIIPQATSQSLFAEGSYSEAHLKTHIFKAIKINFIILVPVILIITFLGNFILLAFGKEYSYEGFILLRYLSISGIFISINSMGSTILNIKHKIKLLILLSFISAAIILTLTLIFIRMSTFGILGVGIGWMIGQGIIAIVYLFLIKRNIKL